MKIRTDFVTNSSSSCFLILVKDIEILPDFLKGSSYIYLDKENDLDLARNFIDLLVGSLDHDYLALEGMTNNILPWLEKLQMSVSDINLIRLIYAESYFIDMYSPEVLEKLKNFIGYYLLLYRVSCWELPKNFKSYFGDNLKILREDCY